ncbi:hypothetical protein RN001_002172 [Aquatica leii]|uniref:Uncharacterized protein n=1 Tax=Aquatica leii TaxID=1421715 RepID=A0AAN7SD49_9COLE|nr:hypothetical protein RN001_002172 [Aquatica leii]
MEQLLTDWGCLSLKDVFKGKTKSLAEQKCTMESDEPVGIPTDVVDTADDLVSVNVAWADSNGARDHLAALKQALQRQQQMFESFMGQQSEVRTLMESVLKTNPAPLLQRTADKGPNKRTYE